MSTRTEDRGRWFIGSRMKAAGLSRKQAARAMQLSPQGVSRHYQGRAASIGYAQLRGFWPGPT